MPTTLTQRQWQAKFHQLRKWCNDMRVADAMDLLGCLSATLIVMAEKADGDLREAFAEQIELITFHLENTHHQRPPRYIVKRDS